MSLLEIRSHAFLLCSGLLGIILAAGASILFVSLIGATEADAHKHGEILYPPSCCNSAATAVNGDCAPIDDQYVTEGPNGYEINLPVGSHPKLKTKGYSGVVPYSAARQPLDYQYHICLATDGTNRFCFFAKPMGS